MNGSSTSKMMVTINCISCYDVFFSRGVSCCALLCIPSMALKSPPRFFLANSSFSVRWCQMMTAKGASKVGAICFFFFSLREIKNNNWRGSNVTKKEDVRDDAKKEDYEFKSYLSSMIVKHLYFLTTLRWWHGVWNSQKKSHSTLRAKRATFTFWVVKS